MKPNLQYHSVSDMTRLQILTQRDLLWTDVQTLTQTIEQSKDRDLARWTTTRAHQLGHAGENGLCPELHRALRPIKGRQKRAIQTICRTLGSPREALQNGRDYC